MNIPNKAKPLVDKICNAYRLKGMDCAMKRFNMLTNDFKYYEKIMLAGYIKYQLGL